MSTDERRICPELWEQNQRLSALVALGQALADPGLDLGEKLQACVQVLSRQAQAERASLMLVEGNSLVVRASTNRDILGLSTPLSEQSISTGVVNTGQAFFTRQVSESVRADVRRQGDVSNYRTGSLISLPLTVNSEVVGVLNLSDKDGAEYFDEADLELAQSIAQQVARLVHFSALHERVNLAYTELHEAQRAKDDLMYMIFHDMKAPLTGVKEVIKLLDGDAGLSPDERAQYLAVADRDLELLWRRISNLLDLNRMDSGAMPVDTISLNLCALAREAAGRLAAVGRVLEVEMEIDCPGETMVHADEDLTERIVVNLLFNALKYSSPEEGGGGRLELSVGSESDTARLAVIDSGPGVDESLSQAIFERYTTGGLTKGSSGLGLYFCRQAAGLMGGSVGYQNLSGGGARFTLTLPLERHMA